MENNNIDIDKYKYRTRNFRIAFWFRVKSYFKGLCLRRVMLKSFCLKNGINYPPLRDKHYRMPDNFLVDDEHLAFIGKVRDNVLLDQFTTYKDIQSSLRNEIHSLEPEIENEKEIIDDEKQKLEQLKKKLSSAKESINIISLENAVSVQENKIKNLKDVLDNLHLKRDRLNKQFEENISTWKKQVDISDGIFDLHTKAYVINITKRIKTNLNFTEFSYREPDFSQSVEKIINGEIDEK